MNGERSVVTLIGQPLWRFRWLTDLEPERRHASSCRRADYYRHDSLGPGAWLPDLRRSLGMTRRALSKYGIHVGYQLSCAPVHSSDANSISPRCVRREFCVGNRQCLTHLVREVFGFGKSPKDLGMDLVYDVSHNIASLNGSRSTAGKMLCSLQGATRAYAPGCEELPSSTDNGHP